MWLNRRHNNDVTVIVSHVEWFLQPYDHQNHAIWKQHENGGWNQDEIGGMTPNEKTQADKRIA